MALLDENTKQQVKELLSQMESEVALIFFATEGKCDYCNEIDALIGEIASVADKLKVEKYVLEKDAEKAKELGVDAAPVLLLKGKNKGDIRFYGIPSGHEFGAFLMTLIDVSKGDTAELTDDMKEEIKKLDKDLHFKVFITPTCPYCPMSVRLAFAFALLNPKVKAHAYEAIEYGDIATMYNVRGVPKTVINESVQFEGAYPPDIVLKKIKEML